MPRLKTQIARLSQGEFDPEVIDRNDLAFYYAGAARMRDLVPQSRGGVKRRGGTRKVETLETGNNARLFGFAFNVEQVYMHLLEDQKLSVYLARQRVAAEIALPFTSAMLRRLNRLQSADTLLLFHDDVPPHQVQRAGGDNLWTSAPAPIENVPRFDYGETNTDGTMTPSAATGKGITMTASEDTFTEEMAGEMAGWQIKGNEGVFEITSYTSAVSVTGDVLKDFADASAIDEGEWTLGEPVISESRGWARCGAFYQERLVLSGLKSRPPASIMSKTAEFFDFSDVFADEDNSGSLFVASADQVNAVYQVNGGRHLQMFSSDAEWFQLTEPLTPKGMALRKPTDNGTVEGVPVVNVEGAVLFVSAGDTDKETGEQTKATIREWLWVEGEQNYVANDIALLAAHLVRNPVDAAVKKARKRGEPHRVLWVNEDDGTVLLLTTNRAQEITGFTLQTFNGRALAVGVEPRGDIYFVIEREIAGATVRTLEVWDDTLYLDGAVEQVAEQETTAALEGQTVFSYLFASPATEEEIAVSVDGAPLDYPEDYAVDLGLAQVTLSDPASAGQEVRISKCFSTLSGLEHWEGEILDIYQDGSPAGQATVAGGSIDLPEPCCDRVHAGKNFTPELTTMPFAANLQDGTVVGDMKRIPVITFSLKDSTGFELSVCGGAFKPVYPQPLKDQPGGYSQQETLFTGEHRITGLRGRDRRGQVAIRQPDPGPLHIQSITMSVRV